MTALLTDNLPLLAGAPNGIKKLRELILELAVRGKLVPQEPSDEPASELLKRIAEEKARLVAEGKIKKQKPLTEIGEEEKPFNVPASWKWTRLGELGLVGSSSRVHQKDWQTSGVPFYRAREIVRLSKDGFVENELFISEELYQELSTGESVPKAGDIMLTGVGTIGVPYCVQKTDRFYFKDASVLILKSHVADNSSYLLKYFISPLWVDTIHAESMGTTVHTLTIARANETLCPLPPLAEQHRIVAKVDELMSLCDRLEAQHADAEIAHAQLVQALLDSLTQASDATDFATNWQRLAEHFHTLFSTEPSIDALKQTLLQLAVMGKLVPQDPRDEPSSELLKRIAEEKARLVAEGKIKKQKPLANIAQDEKPLELPKGWGWARFGDLILEAYTGLDRGKSLQGMHLKYPYFKMNNILNRGGYSTSEMTRVDGGPEEIEKYCLFSGDLLFNTRNSRELVGKTCVIRELPESIVLYNNNILRCKFSDSVLPEVIDLWLRSTTGSTLLDSIKSNTTNVCAIYQGNLFNLLCPAIPPNEQYRIVAKVDQLMVLCDQLKTHLTQARQLNEQLASTLVERALIKDDQPARVTTDQKIARTLLAAEITHQLHGQRTFGQRKLQKVIYLAEHAARLAAVKGNYLRDAAGPHDRQLMNQVENELCNRQWYECIDRETFGHAYRPLSQAGQHRQAYDSAWSTAERATIERVIYLMRDWDTDRCEMTVTLYAAWNDFILEGRPVTDEAIVDEVMHSWNDAKLRFGKDEWLAVLAEMKKLEILTPTGFGRRTTGGMRSLPGFD